MDIGFTGTQNGTTARQKVTLAFWLATLNAGYEKMVLHHGDCVGADAEAHDIARKLGARVVVHPPLDASKRAFRVGDVVKVQRAYLDRNKQIVEDSDMLVAAPATQEEVLRSGTWATIRYARRLGRTVMLIFPDGRVHVNGGLPAGIRRVYDATKKRAEEVQHGEPASAGPAAD